MTLRTDTTTNSLLQISKIRFRSITFYVEAFSSSDKSGFNWFCRKRSASEAAVAQYCATPFLWLVSWLDCFDWTLRVRIKLPKLQIFDLTPKMATGEDMPTFKLVLVGDGGTGRFLTVTSELDCHSLWANATKVLISKCFSIYIITAAISLQERPPLWSVIWLESSRRSMWQLLGWRWSPLILL